jgi:beta-glucosidase
VKCDFLFFAGMDDSNSPFIPLKKALKDSKRIKYHNDYLTNLADSIRYSLKNILGFVDQLIYI